MMSDQQQYEYDDTDLGQPSEQFNLGEPNPIESLSSLINRKEAKQSCPEEDIKKLSTTKSAEREKAVKQLKDIERKLEYWSAKRRFVVDVIQQCNSVLQKLDIAVISDIMTRL